MPADRVTLKDIARKANVSIATVSFALNGKGRMSPARRQKLRAMLKDAGYRTRAKQRPVFYLAAQDRVPLIDPSYAFPFLAVCGGLTERLRHEKMDMHVEFLYTTRPLPRQLEQMLSYRPSAVVLNVTLGPALDRIAGFFEENNVPAVQIGYYAAAPNCDAVVIDNFHAARLAVRHFVDTGHTRIATIRWYVQGDPASHEKHAGFQCAMAEAGIEVNPAYVVESPSDRTGSDLPGRVAVRQLLDLPEPPTAVFVENSYISAPLIYPTPQDNGQLPSDILALDMVHFEAMGLDSHEQTAAYSLGYPERSTKVLRVDWGELGTMSATHVLDRLEGTPNTGKILCVAPRLMALRGWESTLLAPAPAPRAAQPEPHE